jgi:hypothetical protein
VLFKSIAFDRRALSHRGGESVDTADDL